MYLLISVDGEEVKTENGVNKNVIENIKLKRYIDALFYKRSDET